MRVSSHCRVLREKLQASRTTKHESGRAVMQQGGLFCEAESVLRRGVL